MSDILWIVRVKRSLKTATFKTFKRLSPAVSYQQRALREKGSEAQIKRIYWEQL